MNVAIVGATGYGGIQLVNLLRNNDNYNINFLGGNKSAGSNWNELFPFINLNNNPIVQEINIKTISDKCEIALLSLPNGISSTITPKLLSKGIKVIDLSADYRYKSLDKWKEIYTLQESIYKRNDYDLCSQAVYGISEINFENIAKSDLISCPGCYPTSTLIPLIPFLSQGIIENDGIVIDSKSGTSGAGRDPKQNILYSEVGEGISAYGLINHRHTSEIEENLSQISGNHIQVAFTPHLVPIVRGMLSTIYGRLKDPGLTSADCKILLENYYRKFSNIKILSENKYPSTKWVKNTNDIYISLKVDRRNGRIILISVIDNLLKGQAGQAIQNLNIMSGIPMNEGLNLSSSYP
ncbi:MAG: N-acetyl-gamma-glutamyl-phosphate reductase [Prochlorococcus sp. SP3034]|nr:N-acetyl-gamma-glutamyl-phosphate reductase [Prochlorococcus sp. SP3034]